MKDMKLRPARKEDINDVVRLWREMWEIHAGLDAKNFQLTDAANNVMQEWYQGLVDHPSAIIIVAEHGGDIAGYICAIITENPPTVPYPYIGYISEISVAKRYQNAGVGRALVEEAHKWFRQNKINIVEVNVSVKNRDAKMFWQKMGYEDFLEKLRLHLE
jgi:GNAT superfamily N-acetyltransferase